MFLLHSQDTVCSLELAPSLLYVWCEYYNIKIFIFYFCFVSYHWTECITWLLSSWSLWTIIKTSVTTWVLHIEYTCTYRCRMYLSTKKCIFRTIPFLLDCHLNVSLLHAMLFHFKYYKDHIVYTGIGLTRFFSILTEPFGL
jgi:hypothetical protein